MIDPKRMEAAQKLKTEAREKLSTEQRQVRALEAIEDRLDELTGVLRGLQASLGPTIRR
jgi:hypothetical protein